MDYENEQVKKPRKPYTRKPKDDLDDIPESQKNRAMLDRFWDFGINPIIGTKYHEASVDQDKYYVSESNVTFTGVSAIQNSI